MFQINLQSINAWKLSSNCLIVRELKIFPCPLVLCLVLTTPQTKQVQVGPF